MKREESGLRLKGSSTNTCKKWRKESVGCEESECFERGELGADGASSDGSD